MRAAAAEAALRGRPLDRAAVEAAAAAALDDAEPFDDAYASAWYRSRVLPVHVRRALVGESRRSADAIHRDRARGQRRAQEFLARPGTTLLGALRDSLRLTAAKRGCGQGTCGTCTCILDGDAVMACLVPVETVQGARVETLEGLAAPDGTLDALQAAFLEGFATQCGFCTSGMIMAGPRACSPTPSLSATT